MEIRKLKKRLLREELKRRRKGSRKTRLLINAALLGLILFFGGLIFYTFNLDRLLEEDYAEAEGLVEAGQYREAATVFRRIYDRHPGFRLAPQALFQSGEVQNLFLRQHEEAILTYLLVEKEYPDTETGRKAQAQIADIYKNRLRDYSQAVVAFQKLLDQGAVNGDRVLYEIADSYFRLNNFEQARIEFENLLNNFPTSDLVPEAQYRIAVAWLLEGKSQKAEEEFRIVIERWPQSPYAIEARFNLAEILETREDLRGALVMLDALQGSYPNQEALAQRTGRIQQRLKGLRERARQ